MNADRRQRLLVVIDAMEVGGSQRQIVHLLRGLDTSRWQPELVFFRKPSFLVDVLRDAGVVVHHLPKRGRIDPGFTLRLAGVLRRGRFDVAHAFSLTAELWIWIASRCLARPPVLVSSVRSLNLDAPAWQWRIKRFLLRRSAATISNAQAAARVAAAKAGMPVDKITVVNNGVPPPLPMDAAARVALRRTLGVADDRVFGLFVGRLTEVKNLPLLLRALASLPAQTRPWMALAGDGPLRNDLSALRQACGLERDLDFLGERADATRLIQAADFLVLCSHQEGMSNALLEAMAAGCPVIASRVGGNPELVDHESSGLLFESDDVGALAHALDRIATDATLRERLSRQARAATTRRFSVASLVSGTVDVYERCLRPGHVSTQVRRMDAEMSP